MADLPIRLQQLKQLIDFLRENDVYEFHGLGYNLKLNPPAPVYNEIQPDEVKTLLNFVQPASTPDSPVYEQGDLYGSGKVPRFTPPVPE